jgi:hypothetical protein
MQLATRRRFRSHGLASLTLLCDGMSQTAYPALCSTRRRPAFGDHELTRNAVLLILRASEPLTGFSRCPVVDLIFPSLPSEACHPAARIAFAALCIRPHERTRPGMRVRRSFPFLSLELAAKSGLQECPNPVTRHAGGRPKSGKEPPEVQRNNGGTPHDFSLAHPASKPQGPAPGAGTLKGGNRRLPRNFSVCPRHSRRCWSLRSRP